MFFRSFVYKIRLRLNTRDHLPWLVAPVVNNHVVHSREHMWTARIFIICGTFFTNSFIELAEAKEEAREPAGA